MAHRTEEKIIEDEMTEKAINIIFATISSSDSSETSEDEEEKLCDELLLGVQEEDEKKTKAEIYIENVVDQYNEVDFKSHFRITRTTYENLFNVLGKIVTQKMHNKYVQKHSFSEPRKQILFALRYLGNSESYSSICGRFGIGNQTGIQAVRHVTDALLEIAPQVIRWPARDTQQNMALQFSKKAGLPGVVGCIGRCCISLQVLGKKTDVTHSVVLQGVCDVNMMFTNCHVGQVESDHDTRALHHSELNGYLHEKSKEMFVDEDHHLLGDEFFPVLNHLIPPYKNSRNLTQHQQNFNSKLSSTRMVIGQAFQVLKGRWRRLKQLNVQRSESVPKTVMACCVLHNFCIMRNDPNLGLDGTPLGDSVGVPSIHDKDELAGIVKRTRITNQLPLDPAPEAT